VGMLQTRGKHGRWGRGRGQVGGRGVGQPSATPGQEAQGSEQRAVQHACRRGPGVSPGDHGADEGVDSHDKRHVAGAVDHTLHRLTMAAAAAGGSHGSVQGAGSHGCLCASRTRRGLQQQPGAVHQWRQPAERRAVHLVLAAALTAPPGLS
jgi:hypothetical protein